MPVVAQLSPGVWGVSVLEYGEAEMGHLTLSMAHESDGPPYISFVTSLPHPRRFLLPD